MDQLFTFRSIFQGLEDAVICHDLDFNVTNTNPAAEGLFGFSRDELVGKTAGMQKGIFEEYERMAVLVLGGDAIISKTLAGVISTWNKGAENIFGYTQAEAVGQHISILIPPDRLDTTNTPIRKFIH